MVLSISQVLGKHTLLTGSIILLASMQLRSGFTFRPDWQGWIGPSGTSTAVCAAQHHLQLHHNWTR